MAVAVNYLFVKGTICRVRRTLNIGTPRQRRRPDRRRRLGDGQALRATTPFRNSARVHRVSEHRDSKYNGLTVELNKRYSHNWQAGRLAYTPVESSPTTRPDATAVVRSRATTPRFASDPRTSAPTGPRATTTCATASSSPACGTMDFVGPDARTRSQRGSPRAWTLSGVDLLQTGAVRTPLTVNG